jgi:hypothetical protein
MGVSILCLTLVIIDNLIKKKDDLESSYEKWILEYQQSKEEASNKKITLSNQVTSRSNVDAYFKFLEKKAKIDLEKLSQVTDKKYIEREVELIMYQILNGEMESIQTPNLSLTDAILEQYFDFIRRYICFF